MHGWETRMLLRHYLARGVSKSELSRRFGVSRRTIHAWVESGQLDRDLGSGHGLLAAASGGAQAGSLQGDHRHAFGGVPRAVGEAAVCRGASGGYAGGYTRVRDYVRLVCPREPSEPVVRFETPAGHQGQVDFATFSLPWGRRHALLVVLGYSRLLWLHFYRRQTMAVLVAGLESAFTRVGKTHLAISLAITAAEAGRRVYYGTPAGLIDSLTDARAAGKLSRRLRVLTHPALLVVDEIGYLPVSQDGAVLFFQLINARHERASTVLTSNKGFEEWGHVLGDEVMAAALIDRLLHHCHIVNIRGNSYRMREHQHWLRSASEERREGTAG